MIDREAAEQAKDHSQRGLAEFCRKIASAVDFSEDQPKPELLLKRIYDIFQVIFIEKNKQFKLLQSTPNWIAIYLFFLGKRSL